MAKKKAKLLEEAHQLLLTNGRKLGVRDVLINYVWDVQIAMQKGYSFSVLHTIGYSHILLQQLELITNSGEELIAFDTINTDHESDEAETLRCVWAIQATHINTDIIVNFINTVEMEEKSLLNKTPNLLTKTVTRHLSIWLGTL